MKKGIQLIAVFFAVHLLMGCGASSWRVSFSYPGYQHTISAEVVDAPNGNYYVAGFAQGTDSDPDSELMFVAAFNATGQFQWSYEIDAAIDLRFVEGENLLAVDSSSHLYVAWSRGFGQQVKLYKLSPTGQLIDQLQKNNAVAGIVNDVAIAADGHIYLATSDILLAYDAAGAFLWNSEFVDLFSALPATGSAPLSLNESHFQRNGGYNLRFLANGNVLQTARYFVSEHTPQGELVNLGRINTEIGIDSISDSAVVNGTTFVGGNIAGEWQLVVKLDASLAFDSSLEFVNANDVVVENNDSGICAAIDAYEADAITKIKLFDAQLATVTETEIPGENGNWLPTNIKGYGNDCYVSLVQSDASGSISEVMHLAANGNVVVKGALNNLYVKDVLVRSNRIVRLGDTDNGNGVSDALVLSKIPL